MIKKTLPEDKANDFLKLPAKDRAREVSVVRLIKYLRALENTQILDKENATKLIGAVKILEAICKGEFKERITEVK